MAIFPMTLLPSFIRARGDGAISEQYYYSIETKRLRSMSAVQIRRVGATTFTIASIAWLLETIAGHDGTFVELSIGVLLVALGAGWLLWEFRDKISS